MYAIWTLWSIPIQFKIFLQLAGKQRQMEEAESGIRTTFLWQCLWHHKTCWHANVCGALAQLHAPPRNDSSSCSYSPCRTWRRSFHSKPSPQYSLRLDVFGNLIRSTVQKTIAIEVRLTEESSSSSLKLKCRRKVVKARKNVSVSSIFFPASTSFRQDFHLKRTFSRMSASVLKG